MIFDEMLSPEYKQAFLTTQRGRLGDGDPSYAAMEAYLGSAAFDGDVKRLAQGDYWFGYPRKAHISKYKTDRKRVAYIFPEKEQLILKYAAFLLHRYDGIFSKQLYSFCKGRNLQEVLRQIDPLVREAGRVVFQLDITAYGASIATEPLLARLKSILVDDPSLFLFFKWLLNRKRAVADGVLAEDETASLPGTAPSAFFCNVYLDGLDKAFAGKTLAYFRYADDVFMVFEDEASAREVSAAYIREIRRLGLTVNEEKTALHKSGDAMVFLGFLFTGDGQIDIGPATVEKMKARIRRQARKWRRRIGPGGLTVEEAVRGFVEQTNRKFFGEARIGDNYAQRYFPVITRIDALKAIDGQVQRYMRYIVTGRFTKKNYAIRYGDLKRMGYKSLVRAYYQGREGCQDGGQG